MDNLNNNSNQSSQISHLSFLIALLQSIGFHQTTEKESSEPECSNQHVQDVHVPKKSNGALITITCEYSQKKFTLRLPENEGNCNCEELKDGDGIFSTSTGNEDITRLQNKFRTMFRNLRYEFQQEALETSMPIDFENLSITSVFSLGSTDSNIFSRPLNETYTVGIDDIPVAAGMPQFEPSSKTMQRFLSVPGTSRPRISRHSSVLSEKEFKSPSPLANKSEKLKPNSALKTSFSASTKSLSPYLKPKTPLVGSALKTPSTLRTSFSGSVKSNLSPLPKSKTTLSGTIKKPESYKPISTDKPSTPAKSLTAAAASNRKSSLSGSVNCLSSRLSSLPKLTSPLPGTPNSQNIKGRKSTESKLKTLGTAMKHSAATLRRSIGLTSQQKYSPCTKSAPKFE